MPPLSSDVKIGVSQYLGVVVVPKPLHKFKPTWKAILAYYAIAYYAHNGSRTTENMTLRSLARIAAVSESTILRGLEELRKKGAIKVRHRSKKSPAGNRIPVANIYECQVTQLVDGDPV